jgi:hypothetical protein
MNLPYNHNLDVAYENDFQYRSCLRELFCMVPKEDSDDSLDEITLDENNYDEESAEKALNYVYKKTEHHPLFNHLYNKAALLMFSMDNNIGLSVLFSYDYLQMFHKCLYCFIEKPNEFNENSEPYRKLSQAL